jgi:hypothetical protein
MVSILTHDPSKGEMKSVGRASGVGQDMRGLLVGVLARKSE